MFRPKPASMLAAFPVTLACALLLSACAAPTPQVVIQTAPPQIQTQQVVVTQLVPQTQVVTQVVVATAAPVTPAPTSVPATVPPTSVAPTIAGLTTTVFAMGADKVLNPDDVTLMGGDYFVGFQNGVGSDGTAAKSGATQSTVEEIDSTGKVVASWPITGKDDGLTADPANKRLIATVNEDGNSSMVVITPGAAVGQQVQPITYTAPAGQKLPAGGTDSISILNGDIYIVASAPAADSQGNCSTAALFKAVINTNNTATLTPVLLDNATANDATPGAKAGATVKLNLCDPDSSSLVPAESPKYAGQVALVAQGDHQLIFIDQLGTPKQVNTALPIGNSMNDLAWATTDNGTLYVTDTSSNQILAIQGGFKKGTAFMAAPGDSGVAGFVATVDLTTGLIKPIVIGLRSPHGLLFVPRP